MTICTFCDILAGRAPASMIYRGELCSAFMDIQPVNPGHVLVVPTAHATYLAQLPAETGSAMFCLAQQLADSLRRSGVSCQGVNLFLADGEAAGQEVFHVHLHVIPRFRGDGFGLRFGPQYGQRPPREQLDALADRIRRALEPEAK